MTAEKTIQTRVGQEKAPSPIKRCKACGRPLTPEQIDFDREECRETYIKRQEQLKKTSSEISKTGSITIPSTELTKESTKDNGIPIWLTNYAEKVFPEPMVNFGGAVKMCEAQRACLIFVWQLQKGSYLDLIFRLQRLLGLTQRKTKDNYVKELEKSGIIVRMSDGEWMYTGKQSDT